MTYLTGLEFYTSPNNLNLINIPLCPNYDSSSSLLVPWKKPLQLINYVEIFRN